MRQNIIEIRLRKATLSRIDKLSANAHEDRNAIIEELIRIGLAHVRREVAAEQRLRGQLPLAEAAHQARLTVGAMKQYLLSRAENPVLQLKGWDTTRDALDNSTTPETSTHESVNASGDRPRGRIEWRNGEPFYVFEITYNRYHADPTYPKEPRTVGERIRKARMDKGWMVKQLAGRLGVTPDTVINWEKRNLKPMPKQAKRLRAVLGLNVEQETPV